MKNKIQFFKIDCKAIERIDKIILNAKVNSIVLSFLDSKLNQYLMAPNNKIEFDAITQQNTSLFLLAKHGPLITTIEIDKSYLKLYPEEPFKMKLHRNQQNPSIDYIAYLNLLLALCKDLEIYALGTKENLYDYP